MQFLKFSDEAPLALITLNRPEVRNAISPGLIRECLKTLDAIESRPDLKAVIITGEGKAFSAGADLSSLRAMTEQSAQQSRQDTILFATFFRRIYEFPKPVIAAVNGPAMGGGCGLASVCDMVVAAREAIFGYTELKVGFIPALVSVFLVRICGEKKARELVLTARTFSAEEGREVGLVNHVVPAERLLEKARELAGASARTSPLGTAFTKQLLRDLPALSLDEGLDAAIQMNALIRTTGDFKEGVTAFLEKRKPVWKGH